MTTTRSFSERSRFASMFRTTLKQQLPFFIVSLIVFAILITLTFVVGFPSAEERELTLANQGITTDAEIREYFGELGYFDTGVYLEAILQGFAITTLIGFAFVLALVQNAYMHSKKMTDFYHTLPLRRPHLLGVNTLASALTILVPYIVVVLVTMAMQLVQYGKFIPDMAAYLQYIAQDLVCAVLAVLVVYIFTTFVAVNVGTVFDTFALTLVLGMTPMAVYVIAGGMWTTLTYGAYFYLDYILTLSPFTFVFQIFAHNTYDPATQSYVHTFPTMVMVAWAVIGVLLFAATVLCYNRRRSEFAEQTQPQGIFQTITKCVGAFCGGALFFFIFYVNSSSLLTWIVAILIGAVLIGLIVEIILSRGVRSIGKNLKWLLLSGVLCCVVMLGAKYDIFGAYSYVPAVDEVESVHTNYRGRFDNLPTMYYWDSGNIILEQPETIEALTQAHQTAIDNPPPEDLIRTGDVDDTLFVFNNVRLEYHLKNGRTIIRQYSPIHNNTSHALNGLDTMEEFIRENHLIFYLGDSEFFEARGIHVTDPLGHPITPADLTELAPQDMQRLIEAVRADMLAETWESITNPSKPAYGHLTFQYRFLPREPYHSTASLESCSVLLTEEYSNTIAVLRELGFPVEQLQTLPSEDEVGAIAFATEAPYGYGFKSDSVVLSTANNHGFSSETYEDYEDRYHFKTTDPAAIRTVLSKGRNQMGYSTDVPVECDVVVTNLFDKEGNHLGALLVRWDDLPQDVQQGLTERYQTIYQYQEELSYEAVVVDAVEVQITETTPAEGTVEVASADESVTASEASPESPEAGEEDSEDAASGEESGYEVSLSDPSEGLPEEVTSSEPLEVSVPA